MNTTSSHGLNVMPVVFHELCSHTVPTDDDATRKPPHGNRNQIIYKGKRHSWFMLVIVLDLIGNVVNDGMFKCH